MKNNKASLTIMGVVALALLIEFILWMNNGKGEAVFSGNANLQSLQPSYSSGYTIDGSHYTPTNNDPQIGYHVSPESVESLVVAFQQPLKEATSIQVYFAGTGQQLSEERVVNLSAASGDDSVVVDLPGGVYENLRVDINGEFELEDVQISDVDPSFRKSASEYLRLGFEILVILAVSLYLWYRFVRSKQKKAEPESGLTKRRCEKLNTSERWYVFVCFLICFTWSCIFLDQNYGPDEGMRYDIPRYIFETGKLPYGDEPSLINPIWGFSYGFCIVLPYLTSALFMRIASFYVSSEFPLLIAARLTSTLSYAATVYFAIRIGKRLFSDWGKWIFVLIMTLTPQIVFLGSYVNNDSFALFSVVMIVDCWLECMPYDFDRRSSLRLAVAVSMCLLSYKIAYSYILSTFLLYCYWYVKNRKRIKFSYFILNGLMILGVVFLLTGWHFIRNAILYDGDFLATWAHRSTAELYALPQYKPSQRSTFRQNGYSAFYMLKTTPWIEMTLKSMISVIGHLNVFAKDWVYKGFAWLFSVGTIFALVKLFWPGRKRRDIKYGAIYFLMLMASVITFGMSIWSSWTNGYQPQGRYVIYAFPCFALIASSGYNWVLEKLKQRIGWGEPFCACVKSLIILFLSASLLETFLHGIRVFLM